MVHLQVQLPTSLQFDGSGLLWSAGGPSSGADAGRLGLGVMHAVHAASTTADVQVLTCWIMLCVSGGIGSTMQQAIAIVPGFMYVAAAFDVARFICGSVLL